MRPVAGERVSHCASFQAMLSADVCDRRRPRLVVTHSARSAVAAAARAAQPAGSSAPATAITRPASASSASSGPAVDGDVAGREVGGRGVRHDREHVPVHGHPGRHRDEPGSEPGPGDPADDHDDGLPRRHADRPEDAEVVDSLPGVQQHGVEDAQSGYHGKQQGQQRDQGGQGQEERVIGVEADGTAGPE